MERTLLILKPDAVQRGIIGEVLTRFERAGFKVLGCKMVHPGDEHYHAHYEGIGSLKSRKGDEIFNNQIVTMAEGPVVAMVLEGDGAVQAVRKMVGDTEPRSALPGTIRGDYAHVSYGQAASTGRGVANIVHASADPEEAKKEIELWFDTGEIHEYSSVHERFTQPRQQ